MDNKVSINFKEFSLKAKSERELYFVLLNDCKIYIPPIQNANAVYIRGVLTGSIKVLYI